MTVKSLKIFQYDSYILRSSPPTNVVPRSTKQQRPNLTPLKMPEKRNTSPSMSPTTQAEVGSTGSSTPATATPGSAGSVGATSPQWSFPGGAQQSGSPSPLTVTFTEQQVRQNEKLVSDQQPVLGPPKPVLAAARPPGVQSHVGKHSNEQSDSVNSMEDKTRLFNRPAEPLETDSEGRIKAYVSFDEFNEKVAAAGGPNVVFADFIG